MKNNRFIISLMRNGGVLTVMAFPGMVLALAPVAKAADYYWDQNGTATGTTAVEKFGDGTGEWGTDQFWTTDSSGAFADGGVVNIPLSTDTVTIEPGTQFTNPPGSSTMTVTGDVHVQTIWRPASNGSSTRIIDNSTAADGVIHLYGEGSETPAIGGRSNDGYLTLKVPIILEQAADSTVYIGPGGGNNGGYNLGDSLTSTNKVDVIFGALGNSSITGDVDLQGGSFTLDQGYAWRIKTLTISGALGSGVADVNMLTSPPGGHSSDKGTLLLANPGNAYTGDTTLLDSRIRITTDTSLPITTNVYISGTGMFVLNNPSTNVISGLYLDGVEQPPGIYDATSDPIWFTGTGSLTVLDPGIQPEDVDYNVDLTLNGKDLNLLLSDYGAEGKIEDYLEVLLENYGADLSVEMGSTVPEPSSMLLVLLGLMGMVPMTRKGK